MDNYLNVKLTVAQYVRRTNPESIRHLVCQNRMLRTQSADWWKLMERLSPRVPFLEGGGSYEELIGYEKHADKGFGSTFV